MQYKSNSKGYIPQLPYNDPRYRHVFAQDRVAQQMVLRAAEEAPLATINVGDNVYHGGFSTPANYEGTTLYGRRATENPHSPPPAAAVLQPTLEQVWLSGQGPIVDPTLDEVLNRSFRHMYLSNADDRSGNLGRAPFLSALGNHDYGGTGCLGDWQAQIEMSKLERRWVMPFQYFRQRVHARGFFVDVFMVEANWDSAVADDSSICAQNLCRTAAGKVRASRESCITRMHRTLQANLRWLRSALRRSKAEGARWQLVAGHYVYGPTVDKFKALMREAGAQLYVGGHTHSQFYYPASHPDMSGVPTLLTGAGGGIELENPLDPYDHYGFAVLRVSIDALYLELVSDNGTIVSHASILHEAMSY